MYSVPMNPKCYYISCTFGRTSSIINNGGMYGSTQNSFCASVIPRGGMQIEKIMSLTTKQRTGVNIERRKLRDYSVSLTYVVTIQKIGG